MRELDQQSRHAGSVRALAVDGAAQSRRLALPVGVLLVVVVGSLFVAALVAHANDVELFKLSSDPAEISKTPVYYGVVSMLGVALWAIGVGAALVGWLGSRRTGRMRAHGVLLGQLALLTAVLLVDDVVEFHERLAEDVGLSQELVFVAYGVAALAVLVVNRHAIVATDWLLLVLAGLAFAASVVVDEEVLGAPGGPYVEDTFKVVGTALLALYLVRTAVQVATAGPEVVDLRQGAGTGSRAGRPAPRS